jgi:hypothetical protein
VYVTNRKPSQVHARRRCINRLLDDLSAANKCDVIVERDDAMLTHDKRTFAGAAQKLFPDRALHYRWLTAYDEPLLWIPDAVAWCWSAGGRWRRRILPITDVDEL